MIDIDALVLPAGIVTDAGTSADELLLERVTRTPPVGAVPFKDMVPVDVLPPVTDAGLRTTDASHGLTKSVLVLFTPL